MGQPPKAAPSPPANTEAEPINKRVRDLLRQKRMSEEIINLWLETPHKAFGMQVPGSLIAEGRGEELLRLLDDAYGRF